MPIAHPCTFDESILLLLCYALPQHVLYHYYHTTPQSAYSASFLTRCVAKATYQQSFRSMLASDMIGMIQAVMQQLFPPSPSPTATPGRKKEKEGGRDRAPSGKRSHL